MWMRHRPRYGEEISEELPIPFRIGARRRDFFFQLHLLSLIKVLYDYKIILSSTTNAALTGGVQKLRMKGSFKIDEVQGTELRFPKAYRKYGTGNREAP
jgi:hypothetical protein